MRRRTLLQAIPLAATGALTGAGTAAAASASPDQLSPRGELSVDGLSEVVVGPSGEVAFGALRDGVVAVDVSDPSDPVELARTTGILEDAVGGPVEDVFDVSVDGDRLVVAGPRSPPGGDAAGFELYDVSDPSALERIAGSETGHGVHNCYLDGETVYLTGTGAPDEPVVIYDVSGDPEEVARWSVTDADGAWEDVSTTYRNCHDVTVRSDVATVAFWDAGTWLLDVTDPASPAAIGRVGGLAPSTLAARPPGALVQMIELPGNSHYPELGPGGDRLAVGKEAGDQEDTDHDGGPGGIELWDVSDPAAPERRSILAPPNGGEDTAHNFGWRGGRLYAAWYGAGVAVYDLSDPAEPSLLGSWADEETTSFWTARPADGGFVASSYADPRTDPQDRFEGVGAKLVTFPEPEADDPTAASTMTPRSVPTSTSATSTATTTGGATTQDTTAATSTAPTTDTTRDRPQPGFGILASLGGTGLAAWRLARRNRGDGDR